jgi:hypothetical protein
VSTEGDWLREIFDEVMRVPESSRGMDVGETCRLIAERVKSRSDSSDYAKSMRKIEDIYLEQFIHTCMVDPSFAADIRAAIALHI